MKKKFIGVTLICLAFVGQVFSQVEPRITLKGWYNVVGIDFNLGFGEEQKHAVEAGLLAERTYPSVYYSVELMYHHKLASHRGGTLLAGLGARAYDFDDFDGRVIVPFTYRYHFPEQPFAVRVRLTTLIDDLGPFAEPSLGVSWVF